MLRLTGPGKIRDLPVGQKLDQTATTIASLYNFDIDGDTPKPQHLAWLKEHVVPQLGDSGVTVVLRGEASRSGNESYNEKLSTRRVKKVEAFLRGSGQVSATIEPRFDIGEADAETAGEKDGVEDEEFRAVRVTVLQSAQRLVPATFSDFGENMGFDNVIANPPWLMLPAGAGFRSMQINNGQGLRLVSSNPGIVTVQTAAGVTANPLVVGKPKETFRLKAGIVADAIISAVDASGNVHARLAVSVLTERTVSCAFHYVQNPRYGTRTRKLGDEAAFVDKLNEVWGNQANVQFASAGARNLTMNDDLGDVLDSRAKLDTVWANRLTGVQFNVFFVRALQRPDSENADDNALTLIGQHGSCAYEDTTDGSNDRDPLLLCHESGHCLTLDHDTPILSRTGMLMFRDGRFGPFLPKAHVLQARRAVKG